MITIDGSQGEGGGQILRTALTLSLITQLPFKIVNIRAGRPKPGLMRQHLVAVEAAAQVGGAIAEGAQIGSRVLVFKPGKIRSGTYNFAIGTAGSVTLVLQTILPALLLANGGSKLVLEGGTHNPFAPPWDFLAKAFLPVLQKMGAGVSTVLDRFGFYPSGGGQFQVEIEPVKKLSGYTLEKRGETISKSARAIILNIPASVGERECKTLIEMLNWPKEHITIEEVRNSIGTGNAVIVEVRSENITEIFTGFGERGVKAETVATSVVNETREYLASNAAIGVHLADQLMLPFALANSGSYTTLPLSLHSKTNLEVIRLFLDTKIRVEENNDSCVKISFGS
jgi:RNA 3'-terminal phosphate cyclase (ATP)